MIFRKFLSRKSKKVNSQLDDAGMHDFFGLSEVQAIGNARGELITNKAGRAVLRARWNGRMVKLYEAFSAEHAQFIAAVSAALPNLFPSVLELRGAWIMAEWVEGRPVTDNVAQYQYEVLRRIHSLPLASLPTAGFCYLEDFIIPRFQRVSALSDCTAILSEWPLYRDRSTNISTVMHPDISPDNLIQKPDGQIVCVDNELLCTGPMPLLDLCNAMRPLPQKTRDELTALWFAGIFPDDAMIDYVAQAWIMREGGAAFISGDMQRCRSLLASKICDAARHLPFQLPIGRPPHE